MKHENMPAVTVHSTSQLEPNINKSVTVNSCKINNPFKSVNAFKQIDLERHSLKIGPLVQSTNFLNELRN